MLAGDAVACTCVAAPPRQRLDSADAAFVGRLIGGRPAGENEGVYVFAVDSIVKGELGRRVSVVSPTSSTACGFALRADVATGILLHRDGDRWIGGICGQIAIGELVAASRESDQFLVNWGGVVVGTAVIGLGAVLLVRRLRRRQSDLR